MNYLSIIQKVKKKIINIKKENNTNLGFIIIEDQNKIKEIINEQPHLILGEKIECYELDMKENFNFQDNEYYNINNNNVKENSFSNKQIIIKGIPRETTKKDIINYFKKYGEIENVIIDTNISDSYFNKNSALLTFQSPLSVNFCLKDKKNHLLLGQYIFCKKNRIKKGKQIFKENIYTTYDIITPKKQKWKMKNHYLNLRHYNTFNNYCSYDAPTYLHQYDIEKNYLFVYQNEKKENNNKYYENKLHKLNKNVSPNESPPNFSLFKQDFEENSIKNSEKKDVNNYKHLTLFSNLMNKNKHHHIEKKIYQKNYEKETYNNNNINNKNIKNKEKLFENLFNNCLKNPKIENKINNHLNLFDVNGEEIQNLSSYQNITKINLFKSNNNKKEKDSNSDSNSTSKQNYSTNNFSTSNNISYNKNSSSSNTHSLSKNRSDKSNTSNSNFSDSNSIKISSSNSDYQSSNSEKYRNSKSCIKKSKTLINFKEKFNFVKSKRSKSINLISCNFKFEN